MERSLAELESIVRDRICHVCTERTDTGECGREDPSGCALFRLFPQVAKAIQSVKSDDIHEYIEAIREEVCSVCAGRNADGSCEELGCRAHFQVASGDILTIETPGGGGYGAG